MGLFGKSTFLEKELEAWSLETWAWFMRNWGGMERLKRTRLVTPSREFYPPTEFEGWERAAYIFETTKRWMGMANWPCQLEGYERIPANVRVAQYNFLRGPAEPNGTFRIDNGQVIVTYANDLVARPADLIATLAHELSHYLISTIREPIPGGREVHELTTELGVAYAGFAIFGANHAFEFEGHNFAGGHGWSSKRSGYFSERSWAFSLAVFLALKGEEPPSDVLKPSVADLTKRAARYLSRNPDLIEPLRRIA